MLKGKVEWIKFEDQIDIIKKFINLVASHLETRGTLQLWVVYDERFLEEELWGKEATNKRKRRIIVRTEHFGGSAARTLSSPLLFLSMMSGEGGCEKATWQITLLVLGQKIPDWWRLHLGERLRLKLDQVLSLGLLWWAFSMSGAILCLWLALWQWFHCSCQDLGDFLEWMFLHLEKLDFKW